MNLIVVGRTKKKKEKKNEVTNNIGRTDKRV